jgi:hypothetical protein
MARTLGFDEEEARRRQPLPAPGPTPGSNFGMQGPAELWPINPNNPNGPSNPVSIDGNPFFSQDNINQALSNLNFGQAPNPLQAPTLGGFTPATAGQSTGATATAGSATAGSSTPGSSTAGQVNLAGLPTINAPTVTAEQGGFADFNELERRMFESQFRPVSREIGRQRGLADERLQSELAAAGLADSGTGQQMRQRQNTEYSEQLAAQASDASNRAAVQRYGMEYTQSMENARLRQEVNLANAGFDMTAQVETARNFLTASITNAQLQTQSSIANAGYQTQSSIANAQLTTQASIANADAQTRASIASADNLTRAGIASADYATRAGIANAQIGSEYSIAQGRLQLETMNLNSQQEQYARRNFLDLLGLQHDDLARMDAFSLENTALFYNAYLKQLSILINAGTGSFGKTDQSAGG